jgi:hypothetical protein
VVIILPQRRRQDSRRNALPWVGPSSRVCSPHELLRVLLVVVHGFDLDIAMSRFHINAETASTRVGSFAGDKAALSFKAAMLDLSNTNLLVTISSFVIPASPLPQDISFCGKYVVSTDVSFQAPRNVAAEAPSAILCEIHRPTASPPQSKKLHWTANRTAQVDPYGSNGRNWFKISALNSWRASDNLHATRAS